MRDWDRIKELSFWAAMIAMCVVVLGLSLQDFMHSSDIREACNISCHSLKDRIIDGQCFCQSGGEWRPPMPVQTLEER